MASEVKTNKVSPATANTLNVGDAGDTLALAVDDVTGFNVGSDAAGDVLYNDGTDYTRLAKPGTPADEVLTFATGASAPSWVAAGGGGLVALRVYTAASTTWSKSTNDPTKIIVEVIGGGGGSGGSSFPEGRFSSFTSWSSVSTLRRHPVTTSIITIVINFFIVSWFWLINISF